MNFVLVIATLALLVVLFLIFRAVVLWYFRIDHVIDRLDSILAELRGQSRSPREVSTGKIPVCESCGTVLRTGEYTCQKCGQAQRA